MMIGRRGKGGRGSSRLELRIEVRRCLSGWRDILITGVGRWFEWWTEVQKEGMIREKKGG